MSSTTGMRQRTHPVPNWKLIVAIAAGVVGVLLIVAAAVAVALFRTPNMEQEPQSVVLLEPTLTPTFSTPIPNTAEAVQDAKVEESTEVPPTVTAIPTEVPPTPVSMEMEDVIVLIPEEVTRDSEGLHFQVHLPDEYGEVLRPRIAEEEWVSLEESQPGFKHGLEMRLDATSGKRQILILGHATGPAQVKFRMGFKKVPAQWFFVEMQEP